MYLEELDGMKQTDIFAKESSRDLWSFLKPEDASYKGRVQRDLEDRMMDGENKEGGQPSAETKC